MNVSLLLLWLYCLLGFLSEYCLFPLGTESVSLCGPGFLPHPGELLGLWRRACVAAPCPCAVVVQLPISCGVSPGKGLEEEFCGGQGRLTGRYSREKQMEVSPHNMDP